MVAVKVVLVAILSLIVQASLNVEQIFGSPKCSWSCDLWQTECICGECCGGTNSRPKWCGCSALPCSNTGKCAPTVCDTYFLDYGCDWTKQYACPNSPNPGSAGYAEDDGSLGFGCCCGDFAKCDRYIAETTCDWTQEYACPGGPPGSKGYAQKDTSLGFFCCCGTVSPTMAPTTEAPTSAAPTTSPTTAAPTPLPTSSPSTAPTTAGPTASPTTAAPTAECDPYFEFATCGWTIDWACPGGPVGQKGYATDDGSLGFRCCCILTAKPTPEPSPEPATGLNAHGDRVEVLEA